ELHRKWRRVYFITPSGTSAFLANRVVDLQVLDFEDLGPEAVYRIVVKDFPLMVAIDTRGNHLFAYPSS
ncbi:MAG: fumarate hydratase C-terminal domain-containing protein, partial [Thermotogaceae bacterium]|nr:fumarate hydratase C-terminal domain-containing protein [Thermotogaceae bacterium]